MHVRKSIKNFDIIEVLLDRMHLLKQRGFEYLSNKVLVQASSMLVDLFIEITPKTKNVKSRKRGLHRELVKYAEVANKENLSKIEKCKLYLLKLFPVYVLVKRINRFRNRVVNKNG